MKLESDTDIRDDLGGPVSVKFTPGASFEDYCAGSVPEFDRERLEILAIRIYYGKEISVVLYAIDKDRHTDADPNELPVRKIKVMPSFLSNLLPYIAELNVTLTTGLYPLDRMKIINK